MSAPAPGQPSFEDFALSEPIRRAVAEADFHTPTPIQQAAIPLVLKGHDLLATAQTGTGKTAAFTLPLIERLSKGRARARMPRALVLEPVRELAMQVQEHVELFTRHLSLTSALFIGGVATGPQATRLQGPIDVLIATPGRLLDLFERGMLLLFGIEVLVIDEADRMLDMGFIPDVETIVSKLPPRRQTLMLSATMPPEISRIAKLFLRNPEHVSVAPQSTPTDLVEQSIVRCRPAEKEGVLRSLLKGDDIDNAIIFCNRKRDVKTLLSSLRRARFPVAGLHGDMGQGERLATMEDFRGGRVKFLVATDVAGRGLDIEGISHIFNYDVPYQPEDYVHHIGRTGRAGRSGVAVTIATPADAELVEAIEKLIRAPIPVQGEAPAARPARPPAADDGDDGEDEPAREGRRRGRRGGRRRRRGADDAPAQASAADGNGDGRRGRRRTAAADEGESPADDREPKAAGNGGGRRRRRETDGPGSAAPEPRRSRGDRSRRAGGSARTDGDGDRPAAAPGGRGRRSASGPRRGGAFGESGELPDFLKGPPTRTD